MSARTELWLGLIVIVLLLLIAHSCGHHHAAATLVCPLLTRHKLNGGTCDFPELCNHGQGYRCFWAHFHRIDPESGKPLSPQPQRELFQHGEETHQDPDTDRQDLPHGEGQQQP